jgi:hypothetical protein
MAELADALDLGSSAVKGVQVQVLFPAPTLRSLDWARDFGSGLRRPLSKRGSFVYLSGLKVDHHEGHEGTRSKNLLSTRFLASKVVREDMTAWVVMVATTKPGYAIPFAPVIPKGVSPEEPAFR